MLMQQDTLDLSQQLENKSLVAFSTDPYNNKKFDYKSTPGKG